MYCTTHIARRNDHLILGCYICSWNQFLSFTDFGRFEWWSPPERCFASSSLSLSCHQWIPFGFQRKKITGKTYTVTYVTVLLCFPEILYMFSTLVLHMALIVSHTVQVMHLVNNMLTLSTVCLLEAQRETCGGCESSTKAYDVPQVARTDTRSDSSTVALCVSAKRTETHVGELSALEQRNALVENVVRRVLLRLMRGLWMHLKLIFLNLCSFSILSSAQLVQEKMQVWICN